MTRYLRIVTIASCLGVAGAPLSAAQDAPAPTPAQQKKAAPAERPNPVQVQVIISRYRADKKIASMPYLLSVPVNQGMGRLQVGGQVPVPGGNGPQAGVQYRNVGTSITVTIKSAVDGRYEVYSDVSESAVAGEGQATLNVAPGVAPVLKSYTSNSTLVLRDGETKQFTAATDPISGETVRVDVTLNVQK